MIVILSEAKDLGGGDIAISYLPPRDSSAVKIGVRMTLSDNLTEGDLKGKKGWVPSI